VKDPIAGWRAEHEDFSRLLDLFDRAVGRLRAQEAPDYELMTVILTYLRHFPERQHHPREDVAFERLVEHDASLGPLIGRFLQEHRVISSAAEAVHDMLESVQVGGVVPRDRMEAACAQFLVYYRHHIRGEDDLVMPLAARLLTADDWKAVGTAVAPRLDPLFGAAVEERYRELRRQIDLEAQAGG
jgi:hemerythrin-like domain-containing protein